jgi:SET domain-containing protein
MPQPIVVRKSKEKGKGVFATKQFRKNQAIGTMRGRLVYDDDYDPSYVVDMGESVLVPYAPFRYLNHSCEPNAELVEYEHEDNEPSEIVVHAIRTIRPGEELTIDYAWPHDAAIPCLCGAKNCRGFIVDPAELKFVKRRQRRSA